MLVNDNRGNKRVDGAIKSSDKMYLFLNRNEHVLFDCSKRG